MELDAMRSVIVGCAACIVAAGVGGPGFAFADTFSDVLSTRTLQAIGSGLGQAIARAIPVVSASPGLLFEYDAETGAFVRRSAVVGQLFLERAEPLGRGHWNVAASYQYVALDRIGGIELHSLQDRDPIHVPKQVPLRILRFRIDLETHQQVVSATYGVSDDADVILTVPMLESHLTVGGHFQGNPPFGVAMDAAGIGDVFVRAKYRVWASDRGGLATTLGLRLPSGSEDDFQGTGATEVSPGIVASSVALRPLGWLELQAYANGAIDLDTTDVGSSQGRYGVGLDARLYDRMTLAVAFLARHPFRRTQPPGAIDLARERGGPAPIFGLDLDRPQLFDLSIGGRAVIWRDSLILFANVILPLNDDGVRSDAIPLVGLEVAF